MLQCPLARVIHVTLNKEGHPVKKAYFPAGIAILLWSTMATTAKLLLGSIDTYRVLCISTLFAAVALLMYNVATGRLKLLRQYRPLDSLRMISAGLLGHCFYYVFYYAGAAILPASQAFIINYLWPILSVVFAILLLGERLTIRKGLAFLLSFIGVLTVAGGDLLHFETDTLWGMLLCVAGAVCYGAFTAFNKKWDYDLPIAMMLSFFASALVTLVPALAEGAWTLSWGQVAGLAWNGIGTMAAANTCWAVALSKGNTARISNLAYITPFLSMVWISLILQESISPWSLLGLCVIVLGIVIQLKEKEKALS